MYSNCFGQKNQGGLNILAIPDALLIKFVSSNIFIMVMISSSFIFNFTNFCVIVIFLTKLLTLAILFSTAVRATVVAKFVILGILILTSFILVFRVVLVPKLSGILSSVFLILALYYMHVF